MRVLFLTVFILPWLVQAQNKQKHLADFTIDGNFSIPGIISSKMYQKAFDGIYEMNFSVNKNLGGNFFVGLGYQNVLFQNDDSLKYSYFNASIPYNTRLMGHSVFARFTYSRFFSDIGYLSYALNTGYMMAHYYNVNADTSLANRPYGQTEFNTPYVQPEVSLNFIVDKTLSFGVILSYTTLFTKFDPKAPRFNHFEWISKSGNDYVMSWLNFGFSFNVLLNGKNKHRH